MLVYGDRARILDTRCVLAALRRGLEQREAPGAPIERHGRLASLFIAAAELLQGLADAAMAAHGGDGPTPEQDAAMALVLVLARALLASWGTLGGAAVPPAGELGAIEAALKTLEELPPPPQVRLKAPEGYSFYALYPEAYGEAALRLRAVEDGGATTVIGVRSVGAGLAAIAAAALDAPVPLTVRPCGPPFQRRLELSPTLQAELARRKDGRFVVVDEGPGLSGSSFGAVADALEQLGVLRSRIAFLPSHAGDPGAQASAEHLARWRIAERSCVDFDALVLRAQAPGQRLASWFADLAEGGPATLEDLSGGGWRALGGADEDAWPASDTFAERRKVLLQTPRGGWLLKFTGLGEAGERLYARARALGAAGWTPKPVALRHGVMAEPWRADARPLRLPPERRRAFAEHLGRYLGWRAANLAAPPHAGASLDELLEMTRVNAVEALGERAARSLRLDPDRWAAAPPLRRVWTDNRLQAQEWLALPDGGWLKTDAVDHAAAHDLVGAQDIAWDLAAARVEFALTAAETDALLSALTGQAAVEPSLVALLEPAYLAFQTGAYTMAAQAHGGWPQEQARLARTADGYRARLAQSLEAP